MHLRRHLFSGGLLGGAAAFATVLGMVGSSAPTPTSSPSAPSTPQVAKTSNITFDEQGALIRPEGYREWTYVGTPVTPHDMNNGKAPFPEFHNVYMNPQSWAAYKKDGKFPDGTTLVKELVSVGSKRATSGKGYFMGEFVGLEVTIKDSKRFKDEPGNWAYFSFGHEYPLADKAMAQAAANCNSCHEVSAAEDFVFTQYYPVLRAAKSGR